MQKQAQSLEASLGEMKERCSQLEKDRMELEKQLMALQAELDEERRDRNLRTETIADLQGEFQIINNTTRNTENSNMDINFTSLQMSFDHKYSAPFRAFASLV